MESITGRSKQQQWQPIPQQEYENEPLPQHLPQYSGNTPSGLGKAGGFARRPGLLQRFHMRHHGHHHSFKRGGPLTHNAFFADEPMTGQLGWGGWLLMVTSFVCIIATFPVSICFCLKVVQEYERAVIFRLGRLRPGGARGPGLFIINPCIDSFRKIDLRTLSFDVPPQEILSKDSVTVAVDVVVYFRISNATISVTNVEDSTSSTKLLAQTTLRNILGTKTLAEMLSDREQISLQMQATLDEATYPWGVKVERVEMKDVRLPIQLQRAMATEAEATRKAGAKIIAAEGEQKASKALSDAATVLEESPNSMQLRFLHTLSTISAEKNRTVIFPLPLEIIRALLSFFRKRKATNTAGELHSA